MPRNRMNSRSYFHLKALIFPHFKAISQTSWAISRPIFVAVCRKLGLRFFRILATISEIILLRMRLRTLSTHRMVRSKMPLSTFDKALNQILCLTALVLAFIKPCLVSNEAASPLTLFSTRRILCRRYTFIKDYFKSL